MVLLHAGQGRRSSWAWASTPVFGSGRMSRAASRLMNGKEQLVSNHLETERPRQLAASAVSPAQDEPERKRDA